MKFEITSWIATELEWKNKCIFTTLTWPWVRGSSHCVVRFLWLTKYTRLSGWTLRSQPKRWFELNYRLKVVKLRRFEFQVKTQDFSYFSIENFSKYQLNGVTMKRVVACSPSGNGPRPSSSSVTVAPVPAAGCDVWYKNRWFPCDTTCDRWFCQVAKCIKRSLFGRCHDVVHVLWSETGAMWY